MVDADLAAAAAVAVVVEEAPRRFDGPDPIEVDGDVVIIPVGALDERSDGAEAPLRTYEWWSPS